MYLELKFKMKTFYGSLELQEKFFPNNRFFKYISVAFYKCNYKMKNS